MIRVISPYWTLAKSACHFIGFPMCKISHFSQEIQGLRQQLSLTTFTLYIILTGSFFLTMILLVARTFPLYTFFRSCTPHCHQAMRGFFVFHQP